MLAIARARGAGGDVPMRAQATRECSNRGYAGKTPRQPTLVDRLSHV